MEGPHPGWLGIRCGGCALLLLRLIGKVILILQHLHFQHLTHHVSACAAQRREQVSREIGVGEVEDKAMMGGRGNEINCGINKQTSYLKKVLIEGLFYKIQEIVPDK